MRIKFLIKVKSIQMQMQMGLLQNISWNKNLHLFKNGCKNFKNFKKKKKNYPQEGHIINALLPRNSNPKVHKNNNSPKNKQT
jgi:hypothetical protein